jgi:hypothetical protein
MGSSRRDNYSFTSRLNAQHVTDTIFQRSRGGGAELRGLAPGATFEDKVDLGKWFEFKEPGQHRPVKSFLAAEVIADHRLVGAGAASDGLHGGSLETQFSEKIRGGRPQRLGGGWGPGSPLEAGLGHGSCLLN